MNLTIHSRYHLSTIQDVWTYHPILVVYLEIAMQPGKFWGMKVL